MCPPYFRAHTQVRPYENIENYTWDNTLGHQSKVAGEGGGGQRERDRWPVKKEKKGVARAGIYYAGRI